MWEYTVCSLCRVYVVAVYIMCVVGIGRKIRDKLEKEKEDAERSEHQMMEKHSQIKVLLR